MAGSVNMSEVHTAGVVADDRGPMIWAGRGYLSLLQPEPDHIHLDDIAQALSRLPRFNGHTSRPWSVAAHSVLCLRIAERFGYSFDCRRAILMHDAAEAFIGDMTRPLKSLMPLFSEIEAGIVRAIGERFAIDFDAHAADVKRVDNLALAIEKRDLLPDAPPWPGMPEPPEGIECDCLAAFRQGDAAEFNFLRRAISLGVKEAAA